MSESDRDWHERARAELLRVRGDRGGWGYRKDAVDGVEPTALACLGLLASRDAPGSNLGADANEGTDQVSGAVTSATFWLATIQGADGSLGLTQTQLTPGWTTPLAVLVWQALNVHETSRRRAVDWLLRQEGKRMSAADDPEKIVGHDTSLAGWPWVVDTHS